MLTGEPERLLQAFWQRLHVLVEGVTGIAHRGVEGSHHQHQQREADEPEHHRARAFRDHPPGDRTGSVHEASGQLPPAEESNAP
jgi:hypothetical protein